MIAHEVAMHESSHFQCHFRYDFPQFPLIRSARKQSGTANVRANQKVGTTQGEKGDPAVLGPGILARAGWHDAWVLLHQLFDREGTPLISVFRQMSKNSTFQKTRGNGVHACACACRAPLVPFESFKVGVRVCSCIRIKL